MSYYLYCTNQDCRKETAPLLDTNTNEVYCDQCGNTIQANYFIKTTLKTLGQVKRTSPAQQAFSVVCPACNTNAQPKLVGRDLQCIKCSKEITHLNPTFAAAVKQFLYKRP